MRFLLQRSDTEALVPVDEPGHKAIKKMKPGQTMCVDIRRVRSPRQLRLYWALINKIWENQTRFAVRQDLSDAIKCALGHCTELRLSNSVVIQRPKSIALGNLPAGEFNQFIDGCIDYICGSVLPVAPETLRQEIEEMIF
jgi:hypothetical protein